MKCFMPPWEAGLKKSWVDTSSENWDPAKVPGQVFALNGIVQWNIIMLPTDFSPPAR